MQRALKRVDAVLFLWVICLPVFAGAETPQNFYDQGVLAYEAGDYEKAEIFFKKALSENSENADADYYLGKTYLKLNRLDDAETYLIAAQRIDPDIDGLSYEIGVLNQKKGNYKQALALLGKVIAKNPSDALALYHAGISRFMMKEYDQAVDDLLKSAEMSPTLKANGYYYAGVCYYRMSMPDEAIEKFKYVKTHATDKSLREDAQLWLKTMGVQPSLQKPYSLYLKLGCLFDDNVRLAPDNLASGAIDTDTFADERDVAAVVYFSGEYDLVDNEKIRSGLGYSHYQTRYRDLAEYDLTGSIGELYADCRFDTVTIRLSYVPSYYRVDTDSYLMQHRLQPQIRWQAGDNTEVDLSYRYDRNNYFTENSRDGHANTVDIDAFYGPPDLEGYLFCGIGYEDNTASSRDEYYTERAARLGLSYDIFEKTNLTISGEYYDKGYDDTDNLYNLKREDSRYFLSVEISQKIFFDWLGVSAEYTYTRNNSNISDYDYERNTAALYLVSDF